MIKPQRNIYSVNSLNTEIKSLLEMSYVDIWVEGEVSSVSTPASGHCYFTLKENNTILKCVLFKNKKYLAATLPTAGHNILVRGRVSMYVARGDVQLICSYIEAAGEGELRRQFEALKNKLKSEGLFDHEKKQPIPDVCKNIALITSPQGAVLHDIISTLKKRYPLTKLNVFPASVQGNQSKKEILSALNLAISYSPDVIIVARGGGSLEDLHTFNDEEIARALFACPIPTISAVGHETDFTIADFIADYRAPTPTAAAISVVPDIAEIKNNVTQTLQSILRVFKQTLNNHQQSLDISKQGLKHPANILKTQHNQLQQWVLKLRNIQTNRFNNHQQKLSGLKFALEAKAPHVNLINNAHALSALKGRLDNSMQYKVAQLTDKVSQSKLQLGLLNPLNTLARGYSILKTDNGDVLSSAKGVKSGDKLFAQLKEGKLTSTVD